MPTTAKSFESDYGQCSAVPKTPVPPNWLSLFANACFTINTALSVPNLIEELNKHIGPHSKFDYKIQLENALKEIYKRFMAKGEESLTTI